MSLPQLVEGQPARLDIGESLPCRVIGFSGPDVVLALEQQPEVEFEVGSVAYLLIEAGGRMQAVRGRIGSPAGTEMVLRLSDEHPARPAPHLLARADRTARRGQVA